MRRRVAQYVTFRRCCKIWMSNAKNLMQSRSLAKRRGLSSNQAQGKEYANEDGLVDHVDEE